MSSVAHVKMYCPPMEIRKVDGGHRRTAAEPMQVTAWSGKSFSLKLLVTIPETLVTKERLWRWVVSACVGFGDADGNSLAVRLPEELTLWSWSDLTMVAQPIDAPTSLLLADGERWEGSVTFPRCRISNILGSVAVAEAVTAVGQLERVA